MACSPELELVCNWPEKDSCWAVAVAAVVACSAELKLVHTWPDKDNGWAIDIVIVVSSADSKFSLGS